MTIPDDRLTMADVLDALSPKGKAEVMLWAAREQRVLNRLRMEEWWDREQAQIIDEALDRAAKQEKKHD